MARVDRDLDGAAVAPAQRPHRARHRVVRRARHQHRQRRPGMSAAAPGIEPRRRLPRRQQRRQVTDRAARGEQPARRRRQAQDAGHPRDHRQLLRRRRAAHLVHRHPVVEQRRHRVGQRRPRHRRRHLVPEIAAVVQADRTVGGAAEAVHQILARLVGEHRRPLRHGGVRRLVRDHLIVAVGGRGVGGGEMIGHAIDQAVAVAAKAFGIVGTGDHVGRRTELGGGHRGGR